jgi:nicotinate-nucleotide adenylyltransferase
VKIAIFGGSFDPLHVGHIQIAQVALNQFRFDKLFFVPTFLSPFKTQSMYAPAERIEKIQDAIKKINDPRIQISDFEIKRAEKSYTIDTINEFTKEFPHADFYLLMGADAFNDFFQWKQSLEILQKVHLVIAKRTGFKIQIPQEFQDRILVLEMGEIDVSSTQIRDKLAKSKT